MEPIRDRLLGGAARALRAAALLAGCALLPSARAPRAPHAPLPRAVGDLEAFLRFELLPSIPLVPGSGAGIDPAAQHNQYVVPTAEELATLRGVVRRLLVGDFAGAHALVKTVSVTYNVVEFVDSGTGGVHYVLMEGVPGNLPAPVDHPFGVRGLGRSDPRRRGWGTYVVNPAPLRAVGFGAPHPRDDLHTADLAVEAYLASGGRVLALAGTDRDQNARPGRCTASPHPFREADVAHDSASVFHVAFEELHGVDGDVVQLQFHGNSTCAADVFLSAGVAAGTPLLAGLAGEIQAASAAAAASGGGPVLSVDVFDQPADCGLRGRKNVQLRYAAGVPHDQLCTAPPPAAAARFVHVECSTAARRPATAPQATPGAHRGVLVDAILRAF